MCFAIKKLFWQRHTVHATITGFLNEMRAKQNTCVTYIVGGKTISFMPGENKSIILMDSHPHDDCGALIAKFPKEEFQVHACRHKNIGLKIEGEPDIQLIKFNNGRQQQQRRREAEKKEIHLVLVRVKQKVSIGY